MKVLAIVEEYAEQPMVRIDWRQVQFFREGEGPRPRTMITIDMPGLKGDLNAEAVVVWLTRDEKRGLRGFFKKSEEVHVFSRRHWKYTELDDLLEATNSQEMVWRLSEFFTLEAMVEFERRRMPEAWKLIDEWKKRAFGSEEARYKALRNIEKDFVNRHAVALGATSVIQKTLTDYESRRDEELIEEFRLKGVDDPKGWIKLVDRVTSTRGTVQVADAFGEFIEQTAKDTEEILKILELVAKHPEVSERLTHQTGFWKHFECRLVFPANVEGEKIDISNAVEVVVPAHFDLLESRRVGNVVPGRRALRINGERWRGTYIKGARALQFDVEKAGGSLRKYGCTLVSSRGSAQGLLMEVEELILLANLAPEQALQKVAGLEIPEDHPVFAAAEKARDDHRYARILADLLIELKTGVDAAVLRARLGM